MRWLVYQSTQADRSCYVRMRTGRKEVGRRCAQAVDRGAERVQLETACRCDFKLGSLIPKSCLDTMLHT
jgi:hypothetical protein